MHRILSITLLFLFAAAGVQAQRLPERALVRKGNRQYNKGEYEASIGRYEEALKAAPGQFEATYNLGNALYKAERFDRAEQTMVQAAADSLRSDAERAEAFYNLGNAKPSTTSGTRSSSSRSTRRPSKVTSSRCG